MLPPRAMLQRLGSRLKLLTGGARDLPERQRTLRATIEWSHALLDEGERVLFARLSVFSGGRTLEAIEAICDAEGDLPVDTFEGVSSLLDKSLFRQEEGSDGEPRFVMLETVHEFAREKLRQSAEAVEIKRVHAEYFLTLAEEADPHLRGPDQLQWLERLEQLAMRLVCEASWGDGCLFGRSQKKDSPSFTAGTHEQERGRSHFRSEPLLCKTLRQGGCRRALALAGEGSGQETPTR